MSPRLHLTDEQVMHVRHLDEAILWAERARYDDTTAGQCALLTEAFHAMVLARSAVLRALGWPRKAGR